MERDTVPLTGGSPRAGASDPAGSSRNQCDAVHDAKLPNSFSISSSVIDLPFGSNSLSLTL